MTRAFSIGAVISVILITVIGLQAQSGRSRSLPSPTPGASTTPANQDSDDDNQPTSRSSINGEGELIEGDVLKVNTSLVMVPFTVMDRSGKYVPDLHRRDFRIFDNGVEQRIAYFATVDQPFTVVLLIDTSGSTLFRIDEIQDAAISFVNQLKNEDRVMVMSFDDQIRVLSEPTNDRDALVTAIRRTRTGGGTRLYDAVDVVLKQKLSSISGRKAVVLFTDGVDTTSHRASYESTIHEAQESDGAIYSVAYDTSGQTLGTGQRLPGGIILQMPGSGRGSGWPGSGGTNPGDYKRAGQYLHEIALESGGRYFRGDTIVGLSSAFGQVAEELRRQYSLGYYPTPTGEAGQRRSIRVKVEQANLVVKSRDSYIYSQKPAEKETKKQ
jgi:VWFA-related protein